MIIFDSLYIYSLLDIFFPEFLSFFLELDPNGAGLFSCSLYFRLKLQFNFIKLRFNAAQCFVLFIILTSKFLEFLLDILSYNFSFLFHLPDLKSVLLFSLI